MLPSCLMTVVDSDFYSGLLLFPLFLVANTFGAGRCHNM